MGCVATVRGALEPLPGVASIDIQQGQRDFTVHYDQDKVGVDEMLTKLEAAGEPARRK